MPPAAADAIPVLLVDDDDDLLSTLGAILEMRGYQPQMASSGTAGLAMAERGPVPAVALVDLRLPDMDGIEVVNRLHEISSLTETVILTGHASVDSAVRALRENSRDYLLKPVEPEQLLDTLSRVSERWRRRQIEEALRQAEERSLLLLENLSEIVAVIRADGTVGYISPSFRMLLGHSLDELDGRLGGIVHPEDREASARVVSALAGRDGAAAQAEVRVKHRDGHWLTFECVITNLIDRPAVRGYLVTARDVTASKRLEAELRQAQKMETVGHLAGGVAHDFNNVLAVVLGYSELLLAEGEFDERVRADLEEIRAAGIRASQLTRHLLAFSRRQPAHVRRLDVHDVIEGLTKMLARLIGEHIAMQVERAETPAVVLADPSEIEQVLLNLAVNARDAMPGGGTLVVRCRLERVEGGDEHLPAGEYVVLSVTDTGMGMPEDVRAQAFDPFFTTKEAGQGTGLGLSTCHGILKQAGGAITIESAPDRGTTVHTYWPRQSGDAAPLGAAPEPGVLRGHEHVLVVDDDPGVRRLARDILSRNGYTVTKTATAEEALTLLERATTQVDLVLADIVLTGMTGLQLRDAIADSHPNVKVLLMSGYNQPAAMGAPAAHADGVIAKPFTPVQLAAAIRQALES